MRTCLLDAIRVTPRKDVRLVRSLYSAGTFAHGPENKHSGAHATVAGERAYILQTTSWPSRVAKGRNHFYIYRISIAKNTYRECILFSSSIFFLKWASLCCNWKFEIEKRLPNRKLSCLPSTKTPKSFFRWWNFNLIKLAHEDITKCTSSSLMKL